MEIWNSVSRRTKILMGSGALLFSCILCSLLGSIVGEPEATLSQEDLVQTEVTRLQVAALATQLVSTQAMPATQAPTLAPSPTITAKPALDTDACIPAPQEYEVGFVTEIVDGDTIKVQLGDQVYSVRYIGMDAPDEPGSNPSTLYNSNLVAGKQVFLLKDESEVDQYGRLLRYVYADGLFVNNELVLHGFATASSYPPDTACDGVFSASQAAAVQNQVGLWQPTPTVAYVSSEAILTIVAVNKEAEYVDIQNSGGQAQNLSGWRLVSERGNQSCNLSGTIEAGATIRVWAMTSSGGEFNCQFNTNIWNNSEYDPAVLYNPQGVQVSRYP